MGNPQEADPVRRGWPTDAPSPDLPYLAVGWKLTIHQLLSSTYKDAHYGDPAYQTARLMHVHGLALGLEGNTLEQIQDNGRYAETKITQNQVI